MKAYSTLLVTILLLAFGSPAEAQFSAQLQGTVLDQTGRRRARAPSSRSRTSRRVFRWRPCPMRTAASGFPNLAPGAYQVKVEMAGFKTSTVDAQVLTQQTANIVVALDIASAAEVVSVTGTAPTIDVADSRVHATYREEALRDLPFQGRNFLGLMAIAPGVTGRGAVGGGAPGDAPDNFSTEKTVDVSANGRNSGGNQFIMDGLNMTSNIIQGVANLSPNPDAIQEMAIQTNTFSVAEGRASSVNVAITTKSGSNNFRGTGSYIFTNETVLGPAVLPHDGLRPVLQARFVGDHRRSDPEEPHVLLLVDSAAALAADQRRHGADLREPGVCRLGPAELPQLPRHARDHRARRWRTS